MYMTNKEAMKKLCLSHSTIIRYSTIYVSTYDLKQCYVYISYVSIYKHI